jgi:hypothetical protein
MTGASPTLLIALLIPVIFVTIAVGVFLGWVTATLLRSDRDAVLWDAIWAPLAFLVVGYLAMVIPCRGCESVEDGWTIRGHAPSCSVGVGSSLPCSDSAPDLQTSTGIKLTHCPETASLDTGDEAGCCLQSAAGSEPPPPERRREIVQPIPRTSLSPQ